MALGSNQADIKAVITADDRASSVLKGFGDNVSGLGGKVADVARVGAVAIAAVGAAATAFGVVSVKAFSESEDLIAQTNAVLKSTGQIAGVTAQEVTKLATSWENQTKFSDEAVRGAENILLTFTNISSNIFPQTTQAVLDISTALHEDLQSAAIQVGKALQDPVLGITALRRVGVNFNDAQKEVIKNLVDTGQSAKAQQLILAELNREFGGSAKAAGETFSGSLDKLKNHLNDVEEMIGKTIVQGLTPFANQADKTLMSVDWASVVNRTIGALRELSSVIDKVITSVIQLAQQFWNFFGPSLEAVWHTIEERLAPSVERLWNALNPALTDALKVVSIALGVILVAALYIAINVINIFASVLGGVISVISNVIGWIGNLYGAFINLARNVPGVFAGIAGAILGPFRAAFDGIALLWNETVGKLHFSIPSWVPGLGGKGFDVPDIPMLAEGGIVNSPTLALIGEKGPEAVVPLSKGGMGGTINININAQAFMGSQNDARKFANKILASLQDVATSKNTTVGQLLS